MRPIFAKTLFALSFSALGLLAQAGHAATTGPGGEVATPAAKLTLTADEITKLRAGGHRAALLWHTSSDFINAVSAGASDEFKRLGISVVATTDAAFDAARQKSDVETAMAKRPDVILSLPLDPVSSAEAFRPAREKGVKLVFLSNVPKGYKVGTDYVAIVTDDLESMGSAAAQALGKALNGKGEVAYLYHDANYYVTNQRDQAFKKTLATEFPGIKVVAEQGIADPARAEELTQSLLTRYPKLAGIYAPWAEPAEGVLAALRAAGKKDTRLVTLDLSEPLGLDMAKGGNVAALVADQAYALGKAMAVAASYGLLGKPAPAFMVVPKVVVEKANIKAGWFDALHSEPPASILSLQAK